MTSTEWVICGYLELIACWAIFVAWATWKDEDRRP